MATPQIKYTNLDYPEYNPSSWRYTSLVDPTLNAELNRLAGATRFDDSDYVSFQPCPNIEDRNQDRVVNLNWSLASGTWKFRALFDGGQALIYTSWRGLTLA
jgi:hypothetical protein